MVHQAQELEEQGHHPDALAAWDEVIARFRPDPRPGLQPQEASAYLARGVALYHRGEVDSALGSLEQGQACVAAMGKEVTSHNWMPAHLV